MANRFPLIVDSSSQQIKELPDGDSLLLGDSEKLILGDGSDLQIYHDGNDSYVDDAGTGILFLRGNSAVKIRKYTGEAMIDANVDGSVVLYYDNAAKFATTSTGAAVTGDLSISGNLTVTGTTTTVNTVTMNAQNAVIFEGATADAHETTLTIIDPTADRTINLPNQSGTIPVLAAASNTAITATPAELNYVDGVTSAIQTQINSKQATISSTTDLTLSSVVATSSNESRFTALSIGPDADIYLYQSATNEFTIRTGTSGAYKYFTFESGGNLNLVSGGLETGGTERISSGGNLTNIGTISSGAITSSGLVTANNLHINSTSGQLKISRVGSSNNGIYWDRLGTQDAAIQVASNEQLNIDNNFGNPINLRIGADGSETTYLSVSSSGIDVTGTISSGAITSTGALTGTSLDINGTGDVSGDLTVGNIQLTSTGSIELFRASGAFIDFKDSSSDDFDSRIMGGNSLVFTVGGAGSTAAALTLSSGSATFTGDIITTKAGGDLQFNGGSTGYVKSTTGLELDFDSDNNQTGMDFKITHNGGTELFKIVNSGAITFNQAYTFPTADGSANQVLRTDGSGNLSFATVSSGGSGFSTITEPSAGQIKIGAQSGAAEGGEILLENAAANGGGSYTTDIHLDNYQNTFRIHAAGGVPFSVAAATGNTTIGGTLTSGDITIADSTTPVLTLSDTGNGGGGGASGKVLFKNNSGDVMGIGYTANVVTDSDMIISTNAGGTYGGYLGLDANGITDAQSDIILEPKTNVRIATGSIEMGTTAFIDQNRDLTVRNITTSGAIDATSSAEEVIRLNTTGNSAAIHFRDSDVVRGLIGFSNGSSIYSGADDHDMVFRSEAKIHLVSNTDNLGLTLSGGDLTASGSLTVDDKLTIGDATANSNSFIEFGERIAASETNKPFIGQTNSGNSTSQDLGIGVRSGSGVIKFFAGNTAAFTESAVRATIANTYINFTEPLQMGGSEFIDENKDLTVRNITTSATVTADVSGGTDNYYYYGKESGTVRYSVYENSNNVYINTWGGLYLRANQHGGSGGGLGASGAVFNAANGLSLGTYNSTSGGATNGRLQLYGTTANKQADLYCSNGNLHIDADDGNGIYLNWYGTQSASSTAGTYFGNANAGQVARIDGSGNLTLSGTVDGRDVAADGTKLDTYEANGSSYLRSDANDSSTGVLTLQPSANRTLTLDRNIASPSNYYNDLQMEVRATSGTAGIGLHRNGYSHVGIYHNTSNRLDIDFNSGDVIINHNAGTLWGSGNDGSGSGLDADLLDGVQGSSFLRSDAADSATGTLDLNGRVNIGYSVARPAALNSDSVAQARIGGTDVFLYVASLGGGGGYDVAVQAARASDFASFDLNLQSNGGNLQRAGNKVWDAGNDGSGSGLDADTLDGINSGSFLRSDASDTATGQIEFTGKVEAHQFQIDRNAANAALWWQEGNLDQNHVLWNDYYGGPTTRSGANSGFDGIKWNTYRGIHLRTGLAGAYNSIVVQNSSGSTNDHTVTLYASNVARLATTTSGVSVTGSMTASGNVTAYSDIRLKENIEVIPNAIEKVKQIRGVTFTRNDQEDKEARHTGVIAQEVEKVLPEVVSENNEGVKNVAYGNIVGLLIEAMKEQQETIDKLTGRINDIEKGE